MNDKWMLTAGINQYYLGQSRTPVFRSLFCFGLSVLWNPHEASGVHWGKGIKVLKRKYSKSDSLACAICQSLPEPAETWHHIHHLHVPGMLLPVFCFTVSVEHTPPSSTSNLTLSLWPPIVRQTVSIRVQQQGKNFFSQRKLRSSVLLLPCQGRKFPTATDSSHPCGFLSHNAPGTGTPRLWHGPLSCAKFCTKLADFQVICVIFETQRSPTSTLVSLHAGWWKQRQLALHFRSPDMAQTTRPPEMSASLWSCAIFISHLLACDLCQPEPDELCLQCQGLAWLLWDKKMVQRP